MAALALVPRSEGSPSTAARLASGWALATAALALAGWWSGQAVLTSGVPGWATLKANTALVIAGLGMALVVPRARAMLACAGLVVTGATGAECLLGVGFGIDELLFRDLASQATGQPPGRMSLATAAGLGAVAASLLARPRSLVVGQVLAGIGVGIAWIAALALFYDLAPLSVPSFGTLSLPTALALAALGVGVWALDPREGVGGLFLGDDAAGALLRRLALGVGVGPALAMWPAARVTAGGDRGFALAAGVTALVCGFTAILAITAGHLRRADRALAGSSRRLHDAVEDERRAIARELHDELGQTVTAARLLVERGESGLGEARDLLDELGHVLRDVALDLRPAALDDLGVAPAVRALAERLGRQGDVAITVRALGEARLTPSTETAAYRIVQEALTNVVRHADASRAEVHLVFESGGIAVTVVDDGAGFVASQVQGDRLGLVGIAERARLVGGTCAVSSSPAGTEVSAWLPSA